ncbi:MAG TPA: LptA/OstA family protein [Methyloceanibacter sp.]|nr:LptA/OstA family protein [Methyloceanibacter sp.]
MLALLFPASPLPAQTLSNSFGGLSESSDEPIDIESDTLTVYDAKKYATFKGNVKAVQGTTTLRATELDVHYVGGAEKLTGQKPAEAVPAAGQTAAPAAKAAGPEAQINKIEARGSVVITSKDDQTTTSDWALYDVPSQIVTVGGNVVLSQGPNVLKGERLIIDLKSGESRFENPGNAATGGRIRALFMPKQGGGSSAKADGADGEPQSLAPPPAARNEESAPGEQDPTAEGPAADEAEPWPIVPEFR